MPPRSKQSQRQAGWIVCERCKCHISTRDVDVHIGVCTDDEPFTCDLSNIKTSLQQLRHCFISRGSVVARLDGMFYLFILCMLLWSHGYIIKFDSQFNVVLWL